MREQVLHILLRLARRLAVEVFDVTPPTLTDQRRRASKAAVARQSAG
jgi:hypothetical protein